MYCCSFWNDSCKLTPAEVPLKVHLQMNTTNRFLSFLLVFQAVSLLGQSKKEQITVLSNRIDSLRIVISTMKTTCSDNMDKLDGKIRELQDELNRQQILFKNQTQELTEVSSKLNLLKDTAIKRDSLISVIQKAEQSAADSFSIYKKRWTADELQVKIFKDITAWRGTYFEGEITDRINNDTGGYFKIKPLTGDEFDLHFRVAASDSASMITNPIHVKDPLIWERTGMKVRGYAIRYVIEPPPPPPGRKVTPANPKNQSKKPEKTEVYRLLYIETF